MKKLLITGLMLASFLNAETVYSNAVKKVSLTSNLKDVAGKLLPTNAINILERKNGVIKFEVEGYQTASKPNVIEFRPGSRIYVIAFAKSVKLKTQIIKKISKDVNLVKVTAYTDDKDFDKTFVSDIDALFKAAGTNYTDSCAACHQLHAPKEHLAYQWPGLVKAMKSRAGFNNDETWTVIQYLQKHSKDVDVAAK